MANVLSQQKEKLVDDVLASPKDFFELMKPRVMTLVIFTTFVGYFCGYSSTNLNINPWLSLIGIFSIALGAGSSGVLNHWYDRDIDKLMFRTKNRPIPLGKILPSDALVFGILGSIFSVSIIGLSINWLAAFCLGFTIIFYSVFYTILLKRFTSQNIVIGGASGALPPIIGYICATGQLAIEPFILFGIIFFWTPPHFWALAIIRKNDYLQAGIPMLPVTSGVQNTRKQIFIYCLILFLFSFTPYILGYNHLFYLSFSTMIGLEFIRRGWLCLKSIKNSE